MGTKGRNLIDFHCEFDLDGGLGFGQKKLLHLGLRLIIVRGMKPLINDEFIFDQGRSVAKRENMEEGITRKEGGGVEPIDTRGPQIKQMIN